MIYELKYCDNRNNKVNEKYYNDNGQILKEIEYSEHTTNYINDFHYYKYDEQNRLILEANSYSLNRWSFTDTSNICLLSHIYNGDNYVEKNLKLFENNALDMIEI